LFPITGPPASTPTLLSIFASRWRIEPGNGSVCPFRPKASVYQTSGPSLLLSWLALTSTKYGAVEGRPDAVERQPGHLAA